MSFTSDNKFQRKRVNEKEKEEMNSNWKNQISIREFKIPDINEVLHIEKESFSAPWEYQDFLFLCLNSENLFIVAEKTKVVGYTIVKLIKKRTNSGIETNGHLLNIAVDIIYRKKGIGRRLMNFIIKRLKEIGARKLYLEVRISNETAINFYKKLGMFKAKTLQNYYENEDAILMKMKL